MLFLQLLSPLAFLLLAAHETSARLLWLQAFLQNAVFLRPTELQEVLSALNAVAGLARKSSSKNLRPFVAPAFNLLLKLRFFPHGPPCDQASSS